jgi:hypothetical protein
MQDKNRDMKIFTCIFSALILLIGTPLLFVALTTTYPKSMKDPFKPMHLPILLLAFLLLAALLLLARNAATVLREDRARKATGEAAPRFIPITKNGVFTFLTTVLYGIAWQYLGFTLSTAIFFAILVKRLEPERSWKQVAFVSLLFSVLVYAVFVSIFKVPFPEPILDRFLF